MILAMTKCHTGCTNIDLKLVLCPFSWKLNVKKDSDNHSQSLYIHHINEYISKDQLESASRSILIDMNYYG